MSTQPRIAGRVLDVEVAERVALLPREKWWAVCHVERHNNDDGVWCYDCAKVIPDREDADAKPEDFTPPRYSTDIAAAFEVVAWMRENAPVRFKNLWMVAYCYNRTFATFDAKKGMSEQDWSEGNGEHATPLAICLAALEAIEAATTEKAQLNESVSLSLPDTPRE